MASGHALVALLLNAATVSAITYTSVGPAFWTVSSRYVESASYSPYTRYDGAVTTYTDTTYRTVKSTVTPTATPMSISTVARYYYEDVDTVYAFYPTGVIAETDLEPEYDYYASTTSSTSSTAYTSIYFSMPVTMTAPASCPTPFTVTTSASVDVPSEVTHLVTPTSSEVGSSSTIDRYGDVYMTATWWLSEGAAPWTSTSDYYYNAYVASCSTPPASYTGSGSGGGSGSSGSNDADDSSGSSDRYCRYYSYYGCGTPLRTWIIIIATVIPGLFLLGFLESWFWFRRLMMGKSAMRFGTVCWILISLWLLCFTRMQDRRSPDDQKLLAEKWKNMKSSSAFKAWWKWGFRHRYPEEHLGQYSRQTVGIVPTGEPLHPAMVQTPHGGPGVAVAGSLQPVSKPGQIYYYGPPPPGWVPGPDGYFVPPQGYQYPPAQQAGYYGDLAKDTSVVSTSPVSTLGPQATVSSIYPQAPQPVHGASHNVTAPTPPPQGPVPILPPRPAAQPAPQLPSVVVSDASNPNAPEQIPHSPSTAQPAPQLPSVAVSDASSPNAPEQSPPSNPPPHKNDPNDRSLYE
jgi:hypothetical protein